MKHICNGKGVIKGMVRGVRDKDSKEGGVSNSSSYKDNKEGVDKDSKEGGVSNKDSKECISNSIHDYKGVSYIINSNEINGSIIDSNR
ncbi:hypothetical protein CWI38_2539p0020 [Hamiltosporidium tvaerminnensis]|uniref:Uncharacterized protein n=1 Tax=Hamiltosporidium tvaerminnensis TaxID=1176355 RepID=A0A4Q9LF30_9MICR|nr:hypothetical protein CWI38_2539p0020 [Hamiltosporidium tvaerminnensis]